MKKNFIITLLAVGCLFIGQKTEPAVVDEDTTRMTLIYLVSNKDSNAKMYYDQHLKGKDVNAYQKSVEPGQPEWLNPLTAAIFFDNKEAFDWLLPDADPLAKTATLPAETPLDYAYRSPNKYYFQELAKTKDVRGAIAQLNQAIKDRSALNVNLAIINTAVNVNIPDQLGNFPIHYAALTALDEIIGPLVDKGADLNAQDKEGNTPLHLLIQEYKKMLEKPKESESEEKLEELYHLILGLSTIDTADLAKLNNKGEAPVGLFGFDEALEKLRNDYINRVPKLPQEEMDKVFAKMAAVKQKIADAKAKVAGKKPDNSGKKVDDKGLIDSLNALQNSLRAVEQKL